jgi:hypothetical protein
MWWLASHPQPCLAQAISFEMSLLHSPPPLQDRSYPITSLATQQTWTSVTAYGPCYTTRPPPSLFFSFHCHYGETCWRCSQPGHMSSDCSVLMPTCQHYEELQDPPDTMEELVYSTSVPRPHDGYIPPLVVMNSGCNINFTSNLMTDIPFSGQTCALTVRRTGALIASSLSVNDRYCFDHSMAEPQPPPAQRYTLQLSLDQPSPDPHHDHVLSGQGRALT